jgi:NADPH-dependent 2,4-dienoyl-CoA reductase/sulfur reductase-like enzyme
VSGADRSVTVVGGAAAGLAVVETLRRRGFDGRIDWVGDEPHLPYDRPPLSKQFLGGSWSDDRLALRPADAIADLGCERRFGVRAIGLDPAERRIRLADGDELRYERLVIATGCRARIPEPWREIEGVLTLRTLDDARELRQRLDGAEHVVLVGAGFIGTELAATARTEGRRVTVVDPMPVPLGRAIGARLGAVVEKLHRERGVELRCGRSVVGIARQAGTLRIALDDEEVLEADLVVVGLGGVPNVGWLAGSGLEIADGVVCDRGLRVAEDVYAAGDVASWPNPTLGGTRMRVEHRTNATEQGTFVAQALLGEAPAEGLGSLPFVWSDQFDRKLQIFGRAGATERSEVLEGDLEEGRFVAAIGGRDRVEAIVGMAMPKQARQASVLARHRLAWSELTPARAATRV